MDQDSEATVSSFHFLLLSRLCWIYLVDCVVKGHHNEGNLQNKSFNWGLAYNCRGLLFTILMEPWQQEDKVLKQ